jgi:hypothetical protein
VIGDVISQNNSVCLVDVGVDHLSKDALATDIPDLEPHIDVSWEFQPLDIKVTAHGLLVSLGEMVLAESHDHGGLPYRSVAKDDYFVLEVLGVGV